MANEANEANGKALTPAQVRGGMRRLLPPRKRTMGPAIFELAFQRIRPRYGGKRSYDGARMVLVEGRTVAEATRLCKRSRQSIYAAMDRIQAEFKKIGVCYACGQRLMD